MSLLSKYQLKRNLEKERVLEFPWTVNSGNLGSDPGALVPGIFSRISREAGCAGRQLLQVWVSTRPEVSPCLRHVRLKKGSSASESCLFPFRRSLIAIGMRWEERCWEDGVGELLVEWNKGQGRGKVSSAFKFYHFHRCTLYPTPSTAHPCPTHNFSFLPLHNRTRHTRENNFGCCCGKWERWWRWSNSSYTWY